MTQVRDQWGELQEWLAEPTLKGRLFVQPYSRASGYVAGYWRESAGPDAVQMFHGTNTYALELARERGQIEPLDPEAVAHRLEDEFDLPRNSVWEHQHNSFSRFRKGDPNIYLTGDLRTAKQYASIGSEVLFDTLNATWYALNPEYREYEVDSPESAEGLVKRTAFRDEYLKYHQMHPVVFQVNVPLDAVQAELDRMAVTMRRESMDAREWVELVTEPGAALTTFTLPHPIPMDWVEVRDGKAVTFGTKAGGPVVQQPEFATEKEMWDRVGSSLNEFDTLMGQETKGTTQQRLRVWLDRLKDLIPARYHEKLMDLSLKSEEFGLQPVEMSDFVHHFQEITLWVTEHHQEILGTVQDALGVVEKEIKGRIWVDPYVREDGENVDGYWRTPYDSPPNPGEFGSLLWRQMAEEAFGEQFDKNEHDPEKGSAAWYYQHMMDRFQAGRSEYAMSVAQMVPTEEAAHYMEFNRVMDRLIDPAWGTALRQSIIDQGINFPIFIDYDDKRKVGHVSEGHHRLEVARYLDIPSVPVVIYPSQRKGRKEKPMHFTGTYENEENVARGISSPRLPEMADPSHFGLTTLGPAVPKEETKARAWIDPYVQADGPVRGHWREYVHHSVTPLIVRSAPRQEVLDAYEARRSHADLDFAHRNEGNRLYDLDVPREEWDRDPEYVRTGAAAAVAEEALKAAQKKVGGTVYRMPGKHLGEAQEKIDKLAAAAKKIGITPPSLTIEGEEFIPESTKKDAPVRQYMYVTIKGGEPKYEGWDFMGTIQHLDGVNVIRRVPGSDESLDLSEYRDSPPTCDYCKTLRDRKNTFVLQNEDGEVKRVGRSCLKDFLGHGDPNQMVKYLESWHALDGWDTEFSDERGEREGGGKTYMPITPYLSHVVAMVREHGWSPRSGYGVPTADRARDNYRLMLADSKKEPWVLPTEKDEAEAQAALDWVRTSVARKPMLTDFEHNMVAMSSGEIVPDRGEGILAYVPVAHAKYLEKKVEYERRERVAANSEHVGKVGERMKLKLNVVSVIPKDGNYGVTYITTLHDEEGNIFKWFGSYDLEKGSTYEGNWTINKHDEWNGQKQTIIKIPKKLVEVDIDMSVPESETWIQAMARMVRQGIIKWDDDVGYYRWTDDGTEMTKESVRQRVTHLSDVDYGKSVVELDEQGFAGVLSEEGSGEVGFVAVSEPNPVVGVPVGAVDTPYTDDVREALYGALVAELDGEPAPVAVLKDAALSFEEAGGPRYIDFHGDNDAHGGGRRKSRTWVKPYLQEDGPVAGYWKEGGGDTDPFATVKSAEAYLKNKWPDKKFDLTGCDMTVTGPALAQFVRLADKYRFAVAGERFGGISVSTPDDKDDFSQELQKNAHAGVRKSDSMLLLNTASWGDPAEFARTLETAEIAQWHPPHASTPAGMLTHEFAHLLDRALSDQKDTVWNEPWSRIYRNDSGTYPFDSMSFGMVSGSWHDWKDNAGKDPVSGYAVHGTQGLFGSENERVAEAFSAIYNTPDELKDGYTKRLEALLADIADESKWKPQYSDGSIEFLGERTGGRPPLTKEDRAAWESSTMEWMSRRLGIMWAIDHDPNWKDVYDDASQEKEKDASARRRAYEVEMREMRERKPSYAKRYKELLASGMSPAEASNQAISEGLKP